MLDHSEADGQVSKRENWELKGPFDFICLLASLIYYRFEYNFGLWEFHKLFKFTFD